jgi:hypothetical protein
MNAEKWREDTTKGAESMPSLIFRALGSPELAAPPQPAESDDCQQRQPKPDDAPESDEILATLLRAIEGTEVAERLQEMAPRIAQPDMPAPSEPPTSDASIPAPTLPAARPLSDAPRQVAASPAVPQREPLPDHPRILTPVPQTRSVPPEKALDNIPPGPSVPVEDRSQGVPFFTRLNGDVRRHAAKIGASTSVLLDRFEERLSTWLQNYLSPDPRRSQRLVKPPLVAYYWTGGTPRAQSIANISSSGLYLVSDNRWLPDTVVSMTLQRTDRVRGTPESWLAVDVKVIRWGNNGFGGLFLLSQSGLPDIAASRVENCTDKKTLELFVKHLAEPTQP